MKIMGLNINTKIKSNDVAFDGKYYYVSRPGRKTITKVDKDTGKRKMIKMQTEVKDEKNL